MKDTLRQITNLVSVIISFYFVPSGYVFAIWGIIYIGWIAFVIYQFRASQKESPRLRRLGYLFALSGIANAAWLFCWHYNNFGLSVLVMLTLLSLLIASYLRLNVNQAPVSRAERWSLDIPFSVYLGWITVATVANVTDWLYLVEWNGFGISAQVWAMVMITVASVVGLLMTITRKDAAYVFVLVWSFAGIAVKQTPAPMVVLSAWIAAILMLGLAFYSLIRRKAS